MKVIKGILTLCVGLAFVAASAWVFSLVSNKVASPRPQARMEVTCEPTFSAYADLHEKGQVLKLIPTRKAMFAENGEFVNSEVVITKSETKTSKVVCGYLFVRAGTDQGQLQNWENLYINPNNFGGHIDSADQIGLGDGNNYSEYLFPLSDITYWKSRAERSRGIASTADWAALLNVSERVDFTIALNTENKSGFIEELNIVYKCWNPATGIENKECRLEVISEKDTHSSTGIE